MPSNVYLKSSWDVVDDINLLSLFQVKWEQLMGNLDAIAEQRHQSLSEIKSWYYYEYEEIIKLINEKNEEKRKQHEAQEKQQASMPSMGNFNTSSMSSMFNKAKNMMK